MVVSLAVYNRKFQTHLKVERLSPRVHHPAIAIIVLLIF